MKSNHFKGFILITFVSFLLTSCILEEEPPAKTIEEVRKEDGVPVRFISVETGAVQNELKFFATLRGLKESSRKSIIAGKITKINAKVGNSVKENQILVEFDPENPTLQIEQAKVAYENSEKNYKRMKELLSSGDISQQQFEGMETQFLVNKKNYESIKQMIYIETPISGTLTNSFVNVGDYVGSGVDLFLVSQIDRMRANIWVSPKEIQFVRVGMNAKAIIRGEEINGKVTEVSLGMNPMKQAFDVEIEFANKGLKLKPGMTTDIFIQTYSNNNALTIPRQYIRKVEDKYFVFVAENGLAKLKEVSLGNEIGLLVEINSGLQSNEKLISEGISLLTDGSKIKIID